MRQALQVWATVTLSSLRLRLIDQHTRRNVVNEIARCNADHPHGFFFPHVHDLPGDDFAALRRTVSPSFISGWLFLVIYALSI
jgi:hypothetical protein